MHVKRLLMVILHFRYISLYRLLFFVFHDNDIIIFCFLTCVLFLHFYLREKILESVAVRVTIVFYAVLTSANFISFVKSVNK